MNESILYIVDQLHETMNLNYHITILSFEWNMNGNVKLEHDGNYYLEAYAEECQNLEAYQRDVTVILFCKNDMVNVIIDRLDRNIHMQKVDDKYCQVRVDIALSENFFGGSIGNGGVKIVCPQSVVNRMDRIYKMIWR